jgi:hypothetical protein
MISQRIDSTAEQPLHVASKWGCVKGYPQSSSSTHHHDHKEYYETSREQRETLIS